MGKDLNTIDINIKLDFAEIYEKTAETMLRTVIQCLAFHRNQIPFPFETFVNMLKRLKETNNNRRMEKNWNNYLFDRQISLAMGTLENFTHVFKNLANIFETAELNEAMILFGSTPYTCKEAFTIKLPFPIKHSQSLLDNDLQHHCQNVAREIAISILGSQKLFELNLRSKPSATNMFIYFRPKFQQQNQTFNGFQKIDNFFLPKSCKMTELRFESNNSNLKLISLRQDISNINISGCELLDDSHDNTETILDNKNALTDLWYQSEVIVKGFKDVLVKGKGIWCD